MSLVKGIDVSRYQGTNINWTKVKNAGYQFAFIKVTEGSAYKQSFIDDAKIQARDALAAGLKIGYYHFAHPTNKPSTVADAQSEADYFHNQLHQGFPQAHFPLVVDFEDAGMVLDKTHAELWVSTFLQRMQANGHLQTMFYSFRGYANLHLNTNHNLGQYPLWLASYPNVVNFDNPPICPKGWSDWNIWQYSEKGVVAGITDPKVDLNVMKSDFFNQF